MTARSLLVVLACTLTTARLGAPSAGETNAAGAEVGQPAGNLLLSIGVESGDTTAEFSRAGSALRLSNGDIVVANGRSRQLQWFNSSGRFVRSVGRRGNGPNEFGNSIFIYAVRGDTVAVLDHFNDKVHYLDASGRFVRSGPSPGSERMNWIYDRTIVAWLPNDVSIDRLRSVAVGIPLPQDDVAHRAIPDAVGNLWVRNRIDGGVWTGYGAAGRTVGSVSLPPSFEPYQIGDTVVLGRDRDSLGVERIQLRRFIRQAAPANAAAAVQVRLLYDAVAEQSANRTIFISMRGVARNLVTAQELYFSKNARYSPSLDSLSYNVPSDMRAVMLRFNETEFEYWLAVSHPSLRTACFFALGSDWPTGHAQVCG